MPARGIAAVICIVAVAFSASGCGGTVIDSNKLEAAVQKSLEDSLHEKIAVVDCPSDQAVDPASTFSCKVTFSDGRRASAKLKIRNKEADVSIVGFKQIK